MCRSTAEGGQRCAAHTRPRFIAATFGTTEWDEAAAAYASTPEGRTRLLSLYEDERRAEHSVAYFGAVTRGEVLRAASAETAVIVRDASTPHIGSEDGANHVYWNRQGSGWVTTHSLTNARRDAARSASHAVTLDVAARMTTGTRERPVSAALAGSVTITHQGRGNGFEVTNRDLKCNCADYQADYDCEHVRQALAEINERINQERIGPRHTGHVLQSEFDQIMARQTNADPVDLGPAEVNYADDMEAFQAAYDEARRRRDAGEEVIEYTHENATGGLGAQDGGRGFGIELEFEVNDAAARRRIGQELFEDGLVTTPNQQSYHSGGQASMAHQGGWRFEDDCTVNGGEIISPIMYDTPESWENLERVCDIIKRNGGTASARAGSHVHISTGNYNNDAAPYSRLVGMFQENEDLMYRLATNPEEGTHRFRSGSTWCRPNPAASQQYSTVRDLQWQGGHTGHNVALNLAAVGGAASDNVEFRMWDSTISPSVIQAQIVTSLAMTEAAYRDSDYTPGAHSEIGTARANRPDTTLSLQGRRLSGDAWQADTAGVRSFVDRIVRRTADKRRIAALFAITRWQ